MGQRDRNPSSGIAALGKPLKGRVPQRNLTELVPMRLAPLLTTVILALGGCSSMPGADGRYATPARGGWDNFRAELPDGNFRAEGTGDAHRLSSDSSIAGREKSLARAPQPYASKPGEVP